MIPILKEVRYLFIFVLVEISFCFASPNYNYKGSLLDTP